MSNTPKTNRAHFVQQYVNRETTKAERLQRLKKLTADGRTLFTLSTKRTKAEKPRSNCCNPFALVGQKFKAIGGRKAVAFAVVPGLVYAGYTHFEALKNLGEGAWPLFAQQGGKLWTVLQPVLELIKANCNYLISAFLEMSLEYQILSCGGAVAGLFVAYQILKFCYNHPKVTISVLSLASLVGGGLYYFGAWDNLSWETIQPGVDLATDILEKVKANYLVSAFLALPWWGQVILTPLAFLVTVYAAFASMNLVFLAILSILYCIVLAYSRPKLTLSALGLTVLVSGLVYGGALDYIPWERIQPILDSLPSIDVSGMWEALKSTYPISAFLEMSLKYQIMLLEYQISLGAGVVVGLFIAYKVLKYCYNHPKVMLSALGLGGLVGGLYYFGALDNLPWETIQPILDSFASIDVAGMGETLKATYPISAFLEMSLEYQILLGGGAAAGIFVVYKILQLFLKCFDSASEVSGVDEVFGGVDSSITQ